MQIFQLPLSSIKLSAFPLLFSFFLACSFLLLFLTLFSHSPLASSSSSYSFHSVFLFCFILPFSSLPPLLFPSLRRSPQTIFYRLPRCYSNHSRLPSSRKPVCFSFHLQTYVYPFAISFDHYATICPLSPFPILVR